MSNGVAQNGGTEKSLAPPFKIRPLRPSGNNSNASPTVLDDEELESLLPASYRSGKWKDDISSSTKNVEDCLRTELNLFRLHDVYTSFWWVGRPTPPRPLHHQLLLSRDIFVTEQMDMHLVWTKGRIFLKPIPRYLLEPRFWTQYLATGEACECFKRGIRVPNQDKSCIGGRRMRALGFLFSYVALLAHESDFRIAKEKLLLPKELEWTEWVSLVKQLGTDKKDPNFYDQIDERFKYGELRLSRLNKIYRFSRGPLFLRGYMSQWNQYVSFFQDNLAWLTAATVYIVVVLTAMQVGLGTTRLKDDAAFQRASYGFTVFSIVGPLGVIGLMFVVLLVLLIWNCVVTVNYQKKRTRQLHLWKPDTKPAQTSSPA